MVLFFVITIIVIFVGKFIYDSYLTNNTEKKWSEHKKNQLNNEIRIKSKLEYEKKEATKKKIIQHLNEFFKEELDSLKVNSSNLDAIFEINMGLSIEKDGMKEKSHLVGLTIDEIEELYEDYRKECSTLYSENSLPMNKIEISRKEARSIILSRPRLENGLNKNIKVVDVEFDEINDMAEVFFEAMNDKVRKVATIFFRNEEYNKAIAVYPSKKVSLKLGRNVKVRGFANIICESESNEIIIKECIPQTILVDNKASESIRNEGYYKAEIKVNDGSILNFVMFIINDKYAFLIDQESIEKLGKEFNHNSLLQVNEKMKALGKQSEIDETSYLDEHFGKYVISNNNFKLVLFNQKNEYNSDINRPKVYLEFFGEVCNDKLVLNLWSNSYNYYYPENSNDKFRRVLEHEDIEFEHINN